MIYSFSFILTFFLSPSGRMVKPVYLDFWTTLLLGLFDDFLVHLKKKKREEEITRCSEEIPHQFSTLV